MVYINVRLKPSEGTSSFTSDINGRPTRCFATSFALVISYYSEQNDQNKKIEFIGDEEPSWEPEATEAREGRACTQQYSSRACSATSSGKSDGGFPFPSALHSTHNGGASHHSAMNNINKCYWLIPARIARNGTRY
uniref:Uncharacterized protein n=1 Tax=Magallana gigas TaxID=29159 RepID=K1QY45_MAGGI